MRYKLDLNDYSYHTGHQNYRFERGESQSMDFTAWTDKPSVLYLVNDDGELHPFSTGTFHDFAQVVPGLSGLFLSTTKDAAVAVRCMSHPSSDVLDPVPLVVQAEPQDGDALRSMDRHVLEIALLSMGLTQEDAEDVAEELTFDDLLDDEESRGPGHLEPDPFLQPPVVEEPDPAPEPDPSPDPAPDTAS